MHGDIWYMVQGAYARFSKGEQIKKKISLHFFFNIRSSKHYWRFLVFHKNYLLHIDKFSLETPLIYILTMRSNINCPILLYPTLPYPTLHKHELEQWHAISVCYWDMHVFPQRVNLFCSRQQEQINGRSLLNVDLLDPHNSYNIQQARRLDHPTLQIITGMYLFLIQPSMQSSL